jgi:uncharacterized protein (TIGR02453 family)
LLAHKPAYQLAKANIEHFLDCLLEALNQHDQLETPSGKQSLYRIYNYVRFSADKSSNKPQFFAYLKRAKPYYAVAITYLWIKPGGSLVGCGLASPNANDLRRIRQDMLLNYQDWNLLLEAKGRKENFGSLKGEWVKTVPRGYSSNEPAIDLLRYKQLWFEHPFADGEVTSSDFLFKVNQTFRSGLS